MVAIVVMVTPSLSSPPHSTLHWFPLGRYAKIHGSNLTRELPLQSQLDRAVQHAAHLLPAQGPITVFIHHNTLHSFERMRFEEAAVEGGRQLGCEPFLQEESYRIELECGRIREADLRAVLGREPAGQEEIVVGGFARREDLRVEWLKHGVPEARGAALEWLLSETDVLDAARPDLPPTAQERLIGSAGSPDAVRGVIHALWEACLIAVCSLPDPPDRPPTPLIRHADLLRTAAGIDTDALVNPLLIRLCSAFLDQGVAAWPMPDRHLGFHRCVVRLYSIGMGSPARWMRRVRLLLAEEAASGRSAMASIERSLVELGVPPEEWEGFLAASALALRGWAGMMHQLEIRPDRVPVLSVPASLTDFLAVRLLIERAALSEVARTTLGRGVRLADLRGKLTDRLPVPASPSDRERAWVLFHLAQILGKNAGEVLALASGGIGAVLEEIGSFDGLERRRLLHLAYERRLRHRFYDSLVSHEAGLSREPALQAVFCLDEREESIRRHLEEVAPRCETFGAAGFFGVAMYYRGADEVHSRPLCPVSVRPEHEVEEVESRKRDGMSLRNRLRRTLGHVGLGMALGSRTIVRGTLATVPFGALLAIPLLLRIFSPRLSARLRHRGRRLLRGNGHRTLAIERSELPPAQGIHSGFETGEMTAIVRGLLEEIGLRTFSPIVLIIGHGSTSLNNPHESAHDCGACGGGRGGPNARAFAAMANNPEVRRRLEKAGIRIPSSTWFIGVEHNTASDTMEYFDRHHTPERLVPYLHEATSWLDEARKRNAHERCRRFLAVPLGTAADLCLAHVEARSEDLAQTRPEYGHATNAFCIVARRHRTRGLFLDRRAFLVSYDPDLDDEDSSILERILVGIVPVVAGISLEYYFGYVDQTGYGCGTKLPHNVTGLLGVMDGHSSDLRTGLPRQMIEIHEPVRLSMVVETSPGRLLRLVKRNGDFDRLVSNGWITLAALDPGSATIHHIEGGVPLRYAPEEARPGSAESSAAWYAGRRGFLGFGHIVQSSSPEDPA